MIYAKRHGLNTNFVILIDMGIHSGKNRLFVWDFRKKRAVWKGLCSHGCCDHKWGADETKASPRFSNVSGSHCSSLGKYRVGRRGYSNWGIKVNYKLHGLESSNSNAFARTIVLHSWNAVPDSEVYPNGAPEGWGCPAVSNRTMRYLNSILKKAKRPVLLWIYR